MKRPALLALSAVSAALGATLFALTPATADDGPGSGLQGLSLVASAGGQRIIGDTIAGQSPGTVDSGVPDAEATLTLSTGRAFASVAWPSNLAGNAGALLALLGPNPCTPGDVGPVPLPIPITCSPVSIPQPVQDQYPLLNDPLKAEAQYPTSPSQDTSVPGATMSARTTDAAAEANALVGAAAASGVESFGSVQATAVDKLTGARTGASDAHSTISDINLAGGVVTIGSVATTAHAQTDGATATSSGSTTVQDMKVVGVPVYVDGTGVHAGSAGAPIDSATAAVNQALSGAGITMSLTKPTTTTRNGTSTYTAGSLIVDWDQGVTFVFGGASATAGATLPYQVDLSGFPTTPVTVPSSVPPVPVPPAGQPVVSGGGGALPPSTGEAPVTVPQPAVAPPQVALRPAAATGLPGGIGAAWVLVGLALAGLLAAFLQRLPDDVLDDDASHCPLEGPT
ncbi:MAG TPA: choice-of-anchor P family protein [Mycobacteriales bacterium]|nr:choice-of-anchor P family protein [Mycobacteriales bacterium]